MEFLELFLRLVRPSRMRFLVGISLQAPQARLEYIFALGNACFTRLHQTLRCLHLTNQHGVHLAKGQCLRSMRFVVVCLAHGMASSRGDSCRGVLTSMTNLRLSRVMMAILM